VSAEAEDKWSRVEAEERSRIASLKKEKEHYEEKIEELRSSHD
jgi:hypothetical protein